MKDNRHVFQLKLDKELHKKFKMVCLDKETTMTDEIIDFIQSVVKNYDLVIHEKNE